MKLTVVKLELRNKLQTKDTLCRRIATLQAQGFKARDTVDKDARVRLMTGGNTLAQDKGDADYLKGEQVETLWESGKTIRHLTQEEGQGT